MTCIKIVSYSIIINGEATKFFSVAKELRQGSHITVSLCNCHEIFEQKPQHLNRDKQYKFHPMCQQLKLTHLFFADDLLFFFARVDKQSMQTLFEEFIEFSIASGLQENLRKSSLYFVEQQVQLEKKSFICWASKKGLFHSSIWEYPQL